MRIRIYPENPNAKALEQVATVLAGGGVIIYPTDGVYAFGCSVKSARGVERMCALRGKSQRSLTLVCDSISTASEYARIDNSQFRILKRNTPACFTFILAALSRIPDKAIGRRRTVGIRIPDNGVTQAIIATSGAPLLSMSVREAEGEYMTDPELIDEKYGGRVDAVVDGGYGMLLPTTIVDMTGPEPEILRQAGAELE